MGKARNHQRDFGFKLTRDLLNLSGIAQRLSACVYACLAWPRDGLGMARICACGLFAAGSWQNSARIGGSIGLITPPYRLSLYVVTGVTGMPYMQLLAYILPDIVALIGLRMLVAFVPWLSLILI
jgi:TRAP-type C4-dicarboxylate transport system permease large subunit